MSALATIAMSFSGPSLLQHCCPDSRSGACPTFTTTTSTGWAEVMACMGVDTLYLPRTEEGGEAADALRSLEERYGCEVRYVGREKDVSLGEVHLHFYPPVAGAAPMKRGVPCWRRRGRRTC